MQDDREEQAKHEDDLTRREWLLRLGETIALMGFSGAASLGETPAASLPSLCVSTLAALPPGLYESSNDHLSHALAQDDQFHPIPTGSETDYVRPRSGPFEPQFFSAQEFQIVRRIVELILGEGDDASNAGTVAPRKTAEVVDVVAEWLDLTIFSAAGVREAARRLAPEHRLAAIRYYGAAAVEEVEKNDAQEVCRAGLRWLSEASRGGNFLSLREEEQVQLLNLISDDRPDKKGEDAGTRFFHLIKAWAIRGFYTSRAGLEELKNKRGLFYPQSPQCSQKDPAIGATLSGTVLKD